MTWSRTEGVTPISPLKARLWETISRTATPTPVLKIPRMMRFVVGLPLCTIAMVIKVRPARTSNTVHFTPSIDDLLRMMRCRRASRALLERRDHLALRGDLAVPLRGERQREPQGLSQLRWGNGQVDVLPGHRRPLPSDRVLYVLADEMTQARLGLPWKCSRQEDHGSQRAGLAVDRGARPVPLVPILRGQEPDEQGKDGGDRGEHARGDGLECDCPITDCELRDEQVDPCRDQIGARENQGANPQHRKI